jgi:hypothetical protein
MADKGKSEMMTIHGTRKGNGEGNADLEKAMNFRSKITMPLLLINSCATPNTWVR